MRARADTASDAGLLASAVTLRWSRPDLTAALAEHVGETRAADDHMWLAAVGWLVHGRAAIGDGRECASDALAGIARRGTGLLDDPAADRLRIEIAALAAGQREPAVARLLVEPVLAADRPADVRADAFGVLARCVLEERPAAISEATRHADIAWAEVGGPGAEIATAALALLSAAGLRRSGHPDSAVDRAADGLARLDRVRAKQAGIPSRHLAAALAAEWITALIEAGRTEDAREGCAPMAQQLRGTARPTRQIVLLRLALARALADDSASAGEFEALEQAAQDAADCDTPDLEALCLSTLGTLREHAGRLDAAFESMRRVVAAQRRDRARSERFRAALQAVSLPSPYAGGDAVATPPERQQGVAAPERRRGAAPTERQGVVASPGRHEAVAPTGRQQAVASPERPRVVAPTGRQPAVASIDRQQAVAPTEQQQAVASPERQRVVAPTGRQQAVAPPERRRAVSAVFSRRSPSSAIAFEENLVEPSHPLPRGGVADPWSTGRWIERRGEAGGAGGRRHRTGPDSDSVDHRAAKRGRPEEVGEDAGGQTGLDAGRSRIAEAGATRMGAADDDAARMAPTGVNGVVVGSTPVGRDPGAVASADTAAETIPVPLADHGSHGPVDPLPPAAVDPLFGPLEHIAQVDADEPLDTGGNLELEAAFAGLDRVWGRPLPDLDGGVRPRVEPTAAGALEFAVNGAAVTASTADGPAIATADAATVDAAATDPAVPDAAVTDAAATDATVTDAAATDPAAGENATAGGDAADRSAAVGSVDRRVAAGTDAVGCVVVIDAVRAGASVTEGELLREVGGRLTGQIPAGARLRCEPDESALSIVLPGRERSAATDWMHQTLPAVFADMDELGQSQRWPTGTTLRAAVHTTDGPVGAQLMLRLDPVAPSSPAPRARHDAAPATIVRWGVPILAGSGGRRRRADDGSPPPGAHREPDASDGSPAAAERPVAEPRSQDVSGGRGQDRGESVLQGAAPRSTDLAASSLTGEAEFSVEGLGLADLLAGALAAYRAI